MRKPRLIVFASGTATGGGSGFERLVEAERRGDLAAEIVLVVSNHHCGGVMERATRLGVPLLTYSGPGWNKDLYQALVRIWQADFVALSGWLLKVEGLDPRVTFNVHPGPLPYPDYNYDFGGEGMYGHRVHEAVMSAYRRGEIDHSAVSMHFVTAQYDQGPVFFSHKVAIHPDDNPDTLAARVNAEEHRWQWRITNLVVTGQIHWDGTNPDSLVVPEIADIPGLVQLVRA